MTRPNKPDKPGTCSEVSTFFSTNFSGTDDANAIHDDDPHAANSNTNGVGSSA